MSNIIPKLDAKKRNLDLICKQGTSWEFTIKIKDANNNPINLSDIKEVRGQIRKSPKGKKLIAELNCEVVNPSQGIIRVTLPATETKNIGEGISVNDPRNLFYYDIEIETETGYVSRILQGRLMIDPEVTL